MIKVENITKHFGDFCVLDNVNLNVPKGSVYGLVGSNGAGKTTIINHITGVLKPEEGTITIDGEKVYENSKVKSKMLYIADDWFYYNTFTIKQMADFYENMYPSFDRERYSKMLKGFDLNEKRQIRKLSKGMKKQVAFCLCLSCNPEVLILDEPLDGLDPVMRKMVLSIVLGDVADRGMTVLVSSHNLRELEDICDHVGIIHKGKMVIEKALDDLKGNVHKYQLAFTGGNMPEELESWENILHLSKTGVVYNAIIKGDGEESDEYIKKYSPIICERISLTLEEVFIYELGGLGYEGEAVL